MKDMVEKDYNHPSVILYSTGNEVSETAQEKGIALTKEMTESSRWAWRRISRHSGCRR